jgi:DNA polymerase III subunit beta
MKLTFDRESFNSAFVGAASVAPVRSPKPILQNVKFVANGDSGQFMATDLEMSIRVAVGNLQVSQQGQTVLPIGRFRQILSECHDKELTLEVDDRGAIIRGEHMKLKLATENPEEFPSIPEFNESAYHQVPANLLREIIKRTAFATDTESSRYALGGVLMEMSEGKITAVGTDGRRLAKMEIPAESVGGHSTKDQNTIIPTRALQLIDRVIGDGQVMISARSNEVVVKTEKVTFVTRLVEGRFPRWRDVIPTRPNAYRIPFQVDSLLNSIRQAAIVTSEESRGVDFKFADGKLKLNATTAQVGESEVEQLISSDVPEITITLDPRFVIDFLKVLGSDKAVTLEIQDGSGPAVFSTDDGYSYVVMPLNRDR